MPFFLACLAFLSYLPRGLPGAVSESFFSPDGAGSPIAVICLDWCMSKRPGLICRKYAATGSNGTVSRSVTSNFFYNFFIISEVEVRPFSTYCQ